MSAAIAFTAINLRPELQASLADIGFTEMTMVQQKTLPLLIDGRDVVARAKTGSGKTAAFGLGLLNKLDASAYDVQALILCPTRELADQVANEIRRLAKSIPNVKILSICGGAPLGPQLASLQHSPHIVVGTPGRVLKHLGKGTLKLQNVNTLVLDEADRMLDMGFADELDAILEFVPAKRQTLLFSATYPDAISDISARVQRNPQRVDVTTDEEPAMILQYWCPVTRENRCDELLRALKAWGGGLNLVFCNTKIDCDQVAGFLQSKGVAALALHGDLEQAERNEVLVRFANRSASVLVATDVAARGLDVKELDAVFNFELPKQSEVYIHRIGRTARAGREGVAISLVEQRDEWRWQGIAEILDGIVPARRGIPDAARGSDPLAPAMTTIEISGGRKNKLRPGDLLGAVTAGGKVPGAAVGGIDILDIQSYLAVRNEHVKVALQLLANAPIKGRRYRARIRR